MARKFTIGRQNDLTLNQELHQLLMSLRYFNNGSIEPTQDKQTPIPAGAIWNDRSRGKNIIKINESDGEWSPAFEGYYLPANLLINPQNPTNGQIRINATKENLMEFYDQNTSSWIAVRAANINSTDILVDMHNNFMHMTPLKDMDLIDDKKTFLIPYEKAGKLFDDGVFIHPSSDKYELGSDVSVIYNSTSTDTQESWVHINPGKLYKIEKKLMKVITEGPHAYKIYGAFDDNTEFYMLDSETGLGTLMIPSRSTGITEDYIGFDEGIELLSERAKNAEYIFSMSYVFYYDSARIGKLVKRDFEIGSTAEIKIGLLTERPMIFLDGLYLEQSKYNYNFKTGNVEINDTILNPMDMMAIVFEDFEGDRIINYTTGSTNDIKVGTFSKACKFKKPLAFVSGVMGTNIVSPEEIVFEGSTLIVKNFGPEVVSPVKVMVVEANNMYLDHGTINSTHTIEHEDITDDPSDEYILFMDGILVSSRDLDISEGEIRVANATQGQQYVLFKIQDDASTSLSFDSKVMNYTVAITNDDGTFYNECDNVCVYSDGKLVPTEDAILKASLPIKGASGQIVKIKSKDTDSVYNYYIWNEDEAKWIMVTDSKYAYKLDALAKATYSSGSVMIDSNGIENTTGTYYAYTYANRIEEPLLTGQRKIVENKSEYAVNVEHSFNLQQGAFSAYLDGILCPDIKESTTVGRFIVPQLTSSEGTNPYEPTLTYYVERPESKELISCYREVLTTANRNEAYDNGYNTTISLLPGVVSVYINGVRLEKEQYSIIGPHTIILHRNIVGSQKNVDINDENTWNKYMVYDNKGKYEIECHRCDEITIEVREDYTLMSQTIPVRYPGQRAFFMEDDGIPRSLIYTQDTVKIFIDGVLYDGEYSINKDDSSIVLLDPALEQIMKVDPIAQYFDLYPDEHEAYILEHNGKPYVAKPQINRITFEWR